VISSLEDAWDWYRAVRVLTDSMDRLGRRYWESLPWEGELGRDNRLRDLQASDILKKSFAILIDLDDLCILLLFSVFEATVREHVRRDVAVELPELRHPALVTAIKSLNEAIESGSFFRVLDPYKGLDSDLMEEVNQVRRYRNWVAHGRRGEQPNAVEPRIAYNRLRRFLDLLGIQRPHTDPSIETVPD
jgi:hypothetical protein